jgi:hypothetical protein
MSTSDLKDYPCPFGGVEVGESSAVGAPTGHHEWDSGVMGQGGSYIDIVHRESHMKHTTAGAL